MIESVYGINKRLEFAAGIIADFRPKRVLDVGCGTGANLTAPLARQFLDTEFVGIDSDQASIDYARRENPVGNAQYFLESAFGNTKTFDLVIASEVIEHVEDPDTFLNSLRGFLTPDGKLLLTLPNGLGPFELASMVETVMRLTGIYRVLRAFKRMLQPGVVSPVASDTLAISPHINFFSYGQIRSVIARGGFQIVAYRPRTFLCGFGFDHLMKPPRVIAWNADIADRLPPQCVSAWMFLLSPCFGRGGQAYRRSRYARFRRFLNEKRWNLR